MNKLRIAATMLTLLVLFSVLLNKNTTNIKIHDINLKAAKNKNLASALADIPNDVKTALINQEKLTLNKKSDFSNRLRKFPYPFRAMISICSDIDGTTPKEFEEYHKYLNTHSKTAHGQGLGLDVSDSFWMYMGNSKTGSIVDKDKHGLNYVMTFFKGVDYTKKHDANLIIRYFKAGWIDSIHGFGDFSRDNEDEAYCNRKLAVEAWKALKAASVKPIIWINHGNTANKQNFGSEGRYSMRYQQGDNSQSKFYHSDISIKNGIKFVWASLLQKGFGCDFPLYEIKMRDNQKIWGFKRYSSEIKNGKLFWTWNPRRIAIQITKYNLDELISNNQYSIIAQHLGGLNTGFPFGNYGIKSLQLLADYQKKGQILIARTSRLLTYAEVTKFIHYDVVRNHGKTYINIVSVKDPILGEFKPALQDIRGITFYTKNPNKTQLLLNLKPINQSEIQENSEDNTKQKSIGIKWFKADYTDYTLNK